MTYCDPFYGLPSMDTVHALGGKVAELEQKIKATELERDDFHRELMDLRYQLELAKA